MVSLYWLIDLPYYITFIYSYIYYPQYPLITIVFGIRIILDILSKIYADPLIEWISNYSRNFHINLYSRLILYSYLIFYSCINITTIICCIIEKHIGLPIITMHIVIDIIFLIANVASFYIISLKRITQDIQISDTTSKIIDASKTDECSICREEYTIGDKIKELKCGHLYHIKCIDDWFNRINKVECPFHCT